MADAPQLNELTDSDPPVVYERVLFHGTRAGEAIRREGVQLGRNNRMIFTTSFANEAAGYAGDDGEVFQVRVRLRNPLLIDASELRQRFEELQVQPNPSDAGQRALAERLRALGYDGLVIRYPEDARDPSDYYPEREVVRIFDEHAVELAQDTDLRID